ncbi:hypothetical protein E3T39_00430 [Cryobacterium suzukii]|uniref:Uncharacterized protein n=1 Tax=Cryobacterium suzukii TaxID=1259198 RepID=A0A4R9AK89_9MICO|nr:hypothetical protein [Cryobacterium suzukii]TFD63212.1 hypothetical protein E3T39_00430 [Cryobacterium suzukii]
MGWQESTPDPDKESAGEEKQRKDPNDDRDGDRPSGCENENQRKGFEADERGCPDVHGGGEVIKLPPGTCQKFLYSP